MPSFASGIGRVGALTICSGVQDHLSFTGMTCYLRSVPISSRKERKRLALRTHDLASRWMQNQYNLHRQSSRSRGCPRYSSLAYIIKLVKAGRLNHKGIPVQIRHIHVSSKEAALPIYMGNSRALLRALLVVIDDEAFRESPRDTATEAKHARTAFGASTSFSIPNSSAVFRVSQYEMCGSKVTSQSI